MFEPFLIFTFIFFFLLILWYLTEDEFLKKFTIVSGCLMVFTGFINWWIISKSVTVVCN